MRIFEISRGISSCLVAVGPSATADRSTGARAMYFVMRILLLARVATLTQGLARSLSRGRLKERESRRGKSALTARCRTPSRLRPDLLADLFVAAPRHRLSRN